MPIEVLSPRLARFTTCTGLLLNDHERYSLAERPTFHHAHNVPFLSVDAWRGVDVKAGTSPFVPSEFRNVEGVIPLNYNSHVHSIFYHGALRSHAAYRECSVKGAIAIGTILLWRCHGYADVSG